MTFISHKFQILCIKSEIRIIIIFYINVCAHNLYAKNGRLLLSNFKAEVLEVGLF